MYQSQFFPTAEIYRIPSLLKTDSGTLLAFAEKRKSYFDQGDKDIVVKRSFDEGETWQEMNIVDSNDNHSSSNPVPIYDEINDRIVLVFSHYSGTELNSRDNRIYVTFSDDEGETWSERQEISYLIPNLDKVFLAGPGHGIQLKNSSFNGRLVVPVWGT
ncbi:MAG: glycoside hydrolase, partial [Pseudomonadales bacterium]|nr:glycoside hydrolase [Pseudomonadales bacterium]